MLTRFLAFLLILVFFFVVYFTYFEGLFYNKRNSDRGQKYKDIDVILLSTFQKHKNKSLDLIRNRIYWSSYAESLVPKGPLYNESMAFLEKVRHQHFKNITQANQKLCGSGQNGIVEVEEGITMCVRYKQENHYIYDIEMETFHLPIRNIRFKSIAEALAFYLSRLLGMDNVPEVVLSKVYKFSGQWQRRDILNMEWQEDKPVALLKWINNARSKTLTPLAIQNAYKTGKPFCSGTIYHYSSFLHSTPSAIAELIQWGTLIIFDNLLGHNDRFIHYLPIKEGGRGSRAINGSLFNSITSPYRKIWLIDNESAFFYGNKDGSKIKFIFFKLLKIHDKMLKTMCIFQYTVVVKLRKLSQHPSAFQHLWDYASFHEPLLKTLKKDERFILLGKLFNSRLHDIILWIDHCKSLSLEQR